MSTQWLDHGTSVNGSVRVAVLLCDHLASAGSQLDLPELLRWFAEHDPDVVVHILPRLCTRPQDLPDILAETGACRVVLGLCRSQYEVGAIDTQLRQAGLDPVGLETVDLGWSCARLSSPELATGKAQILLAAAVAKARAYFGSSVENVKPRLPTRFSRRSLLRLPLLTYEVVPSISRDRCVAERGCTLCVHACPYGALESKNGVIRLDKARCRSCSRCVTVCPREAVLFPGYTASQIDAQVRALLDPRIGTLQPRGILFMCAHMRAHSSVAPESLHPGWMPLRLPCLAMAPPTWYLVPLGLGASAVGVLPCSDDCHGTLTEVVREHVQFCQDFLEAIGAPADLIQYRPAIDRPPADRGSSIGLTELEDRLPQPAFSVQPRAVAAVLLDLARRYSRDEWTPLAGDASVFRHPAAPLGLVEIDETTCTVCGLCADACPTGALQFETTAEQSLLRFEASSCIACGQCLSICPERARGAIRVQRAIAWERLRSGGQVVTRDLVARCARCGAPIASGRMLDRIMALLADEPPGLQSTLSRYCTSCRVMAGSSEGGTRHATR